MDAGGKPDTDSRWAAQIAAALDWWREAGVDCDFIDEPQDWLAKVAPAQGLEMLKPVADAETTRAPQPSPETERFGGRPGPRDTGPAIDPATLPQNLLGFREWWMTAPALEAGPLARRVAPRGPAGAELMVVVPYPDEEDVEHLLSGQRGRLLSGIVAALGLSEERVYVASALPRPSLAPDWEALAHTGLGAVLRHHISLVVPHRLLIFGNGILPLLGHDPANKPRHLPEINHGAGKIPLLIEMDLAALLVRPRAKAGLWNRLLDWTGAQDT